MKEGNSLAEQFEDLRVWQKARVQAGSVYKSFAIGSAAKWDFGFGEQSQLNF
jgi:hypothetical protein